jgi:predicted esterase
VFSAAWHRLGRVSAKAARPFAFVCVGTAAVLLVALPRAASASGAEKPWCGPDVVELSDHVCFADGGAGAERKTLILYLHGMLVPVPGFQYVQQKALAMEAKARHLTVLFPTSPLTKDGYYWPTSAAAQKEQEPALLAGLAKARAALAERVGHSFDETFVVGFSSGAYYGSSLALRGALDVDGYIVLAGGSSWGRPSAGDAHGRRAPVFVGVSASDSQTASHSRAFAGTLAALHWPYRVEERNVGHLVDDVFLAHGLAWLRGRTRVAPGATTVTATATR